MGFSHYKLNLNTWVRGTGVMWLKLKLGAKGKEGSEPDGIGFSRTMLPVKSLEEQQGAYSVILSFLLPLPCK